MPVCQPSGGSSGHCALWACTVLNLIPCWDLGSTPCGFSWANLSGTASAEMKLSSFTGCYLTPAESLDYFNIAWFFRFWEGLSAEIVAWGLSWLCAVVLVLFRIEGRCVLVLWLMFVLFLRSVLHWYELISCFKNTPAGARSKITDAELELTGPVELRESLARICLHHTGMLRFQVFQVVFLLFHYVEDSRHGYIWFKGKFFH